MRGFFHGASHHHVERVLDPLVRVDGLKSFKGTLEVSHGPAEGQAPLRGRAGHGGRLGDAGGRVGHDALGEQEIGAGDLETVSAAEQKRQDGGDGQNGISEEIEMKLEQRKSQSN